MAVERIFDRCDDDTSPNREWKQQLECRNVEGDRCHGDQYIFATDSRSGRHRVQEIYDRAMGDGHAFRLACRARRIDDVREDRGCDLTRAPEPRFRCGYGLFHQNGMCLADLESRKQMPLGEQPLHSGILDHRCDSFGRITWIEGQVRPACLENAQQPDEHLGRSIDAKPDEFLGPNTKLSEPTCHPIGSGIELPVGERSFLEDDGDRIRTPRCLLLKQLMDTPVSRVVGRGFVPECGELATFFRIQQRHCGDPPSRLDDHLEQNRLEMMQPAFDRFPIEQSTVVIAVDHKSGVGLHHVQE